MYKNDENTILFSHSSRNTPSLVFLKNMINPNDGVSTSPTLNDD
jgi:hypothetical protein